MDKKGMLFVMTGASGVGKDTIRQAALPDLDNLFYSISATTREKRPGEIHEKHYHFYKDSVFQKMVEDDGFLEHAEYVGDYYGTPRKPVEEALAKGQDVLLEVELLGARKVKEKMPNAVMLFIAPPSLSELERRLRGRGTDSEERIQKRLARARAEIKAVKEFDYIIINNVLAQAVQSFCGIIRAERAKTKHLQDKDITVLLQEL